MSRSQGRDLKPPVDGMFYETFGFGTFFRYHNFKNEIDAWDTTVSRVRWDTFFQRPLPHIWTILEALFKVLYQ